MRTLNIIICLCTLLVATTALAQKKEDNLKCTATEKGLNFVNQEGKIIAFVELNIKKRRITPIVNGTVAVYPYRDGGKVEIVNSSGIIGSFKTKYMHDMLLLSDHYLAIRGDDTSLKYALYDSNGNKKTETLYANIDAPDEQNYFFADKGFNNNTTYGYLNTEGKEIIPVMHRSLGFFNKNGITHANKNLIDRHNKIVKKAEKDTAYYSRKGSTHYLYSTSENNLFGILDHNFKPITAALFLTSKLKVAPNNHFTYTINDKNFTIDEKGNVLPKALSHEYETALVLMPKPSTYQQSYEWVAANKLLNLAAEKNYAPAQKVLDSLYNDANYVKLNPKAKEFFNANLEKNAIAGNTNSMYELGKAYLHGIEPFTTPVEKGVKWLQDAANKNHQKAAYDLVFYYARKLDEVNAIEVLKNYKGPRDFRLDEIYAPGGIYRLLGQYSSNDEQQQEAFYNKAIGLGNLDAGYEYGVKLLSSADANKIAKGLKIMEENCQKGQVKSMNLLGGYYSIYANNPARIDRNKSNAYYTRAMQSRKASIYEKKEAEIGMLENRKNEPLAVGTILEIENKRKAIVFRDSFGFRTNDNKYYVSALSNYTDFKKYNIIKGALGTKNCNACKGTGKTYKQVANGSYTTSDVTYKTGSTVSGDYKVTTTKTHNTYKSVEDKCAVCNGYGLVAN